MGDKSPKDREKRKKQHDREVAEANRQRLERQNRSSGGGNSETAPARKVG